MDKYPMIIMVIDYLYDGNVAFGVRQTDNKFWLSDGDLYTVDELEKEYRIIAISHQMMLDAFKYMSGGKR